MTEPKAYNENSPAFDVRTDVKREQWQLLLSNVRASTVPTALVGGLFAVFFSHFASAPHTQWWWAALLSVLAARWWLAAAGEGGLGLRRGPDWCLHLSLFASGLLWGAAPLLVLHHADDTLLFTAVLLAAGVALSAFGSFSVSVAAVVAMVLPIVLGNLAMIALAHSTAYYALGAALLLLYGHQAVVMAQSRRVLAKQIRLRVENALLASQLSAQADKTAAELERRMDTERVLRASRDKAERMSGTDSLTDIANRRYFDRRLKQEISRAFRERTQISLVLCDIDYFKQYNDTYGHQQGDECIKALARVLVAFCRRGGDLAARTGGEEFALILPNTDHAAALRLAENARSAFDGLAIVHAGSALKANATASFGVATMVPAHLEAGEALIRRADQALYLAKSRGRNQVVSESALEQNMRAS
ncbi:MAG: diguanylate cyclase [Gammaproteobacteria bacterium]|nr:diguanylate cyclase [Gammaproteobacteria bacterium]